MLSFEALHTEEKARTGKIITPHGEVATPVFMAVGTAGSVKAVTPQQVRQAGIGMVLGNTYHLMLRPGADIVADLGGLHKMMAWDGPILTDSGGYQVFSLAHLRKIDDAAVTFQSHIDGSTVELSPERAIEIQQQLGADVIMQLDECPPADADHNQVAEAVRRSAAWAGRCKEMWLRGDTDRQALFGIQQGGVFNDHRAASAEALVKLDLPGYAIGGLSVGEGHEAMVSVLDAMDGQFPREKPRYLMGVGEPRDILAAVAAGVDMFDCVLPTRNARNACVLTWNGRMKMRNAQWTRDERPLDENCTCYACEGGRFSRAAIRHFFMAKEMLGPTLATIHNLHFMSELMASIRDAIAAGELADRSAQWLAAMYADK